MKLYKNAISEFLKIAEKYIKNNRTIDDMIDELAGSIKAFEHRANEWEIEKDVIRLCKSKAAKESRILDVAKCIRDNAENELLTIEIGGNYLVGLAVALNVETIDLAKVRYFLTGELY